MGQIYTFGAFGHTPDANTTSPAKPRPPPPHTMLKLLPVISSDFQHCIGWGGGRATRFLKGKQRIFQTSVVKHR